MANRFRQEYRELKPEDQRLIEEIKIKAEQIEHLIKAVPPDRYVALGMTALEESVMWFVKAITS